MQSVSYSSIPRDVAISYECIGVTDQKKARARSRNLYPACVFNVLPNVFPISSSTPRKPTLESAPSGSYLFDLCIALNFTTTPMRFEHCFNNIAWNARSCSTVLLFYMFVYIVFTFILVAHLYPHNMVTYTGQELFKHNIASVTVGKLPQPLLDTIKDNGICAVTRGCKAGRNRQRTFRPIIGGRPGFVPTYHQRGVNNVNIIRLKPTHFETQRQGWHVTK